MCWNHDSTHSSGRRSCWAEAPFGHQHSLSSTTHLITGSVFLKPELRIIDFTLWLWCFLTREPTKSRSNHSFRSKFADSGVGFEKFCMHKLSHNISDFYYFNATTSCDDSIMADTLPLCGNLKIYWEIWTLKAIFIWRFHRETECFLHTELSSGGCKMLRINTKQHQNVFDVT